MSAFYIGQKIKKVRGPANLGLTAVVVEFGSHPFSPGTDMRVRADRQVEAVNIFDRSTRIAPAGSEGWTRSALWEPIIPDGLESLEEINALWTPEPATVRV